MRADVVFVDADVRNSAGWVTRYLEAIQDRGADVAVAHYVRRFDRDDAIVHIWDPADFRHSIPALGSRSDMAEIMQYRAG